MEEESGAKPTKNCLISLSLLVSRRGRLTAALARTRG